MKNTLSDTIEKLRGKHPDHHSKNVIDALVSYVEWVRDNPILLEMRAGILSAGEFAKCTMAELEIAKFVEIFFSDTEERTRNTGWIDMANILRNNLNEKLGLRDRSHTQTMPHERLRQEYRKGIERVFKQKDLDFQLPWYEKGGRSDMPELEWRLRSMVQDYKPSATYVGACTALECMRSEEFYAYMTYINQCVRGLKVEETRYVMDHVSNGASRITKMMHPLLKRCEQSPHVALFAMQGIWEVRRIESISTEALKRPSRT